KKTFAFKIMKVIALPNNSENGAASNIIAFNINFTNVPYNDTPIQFITFKKVWKYL
ncbi:hypothetical protein QR685DRAFT_447118, partial [Neurospora intermedia]